MILLFLHVIIIAHENYESVNERKAKKISEKNYDCPNVTIQVRNERTMFMLMSLDFHSTRLTAVRSWPFFESANFFSSRPK